MSIIVLILALLHCLACSGNISYHQPYSPYFSQTGQDKFLDEVIFKGKENGVFIDVGAHDGISFSNTYYFEKARNWTGICIEPHPDRFKELQKNRSAYCYGACAGNYNGIVEFLKIEGPAEMLSGIYTFYDPRHLARIEKEIALYGGASFLIEVPVRTISSMLEECNITYVDFISIDVEGGEKNVLEGIDFNRFYIEYILLENNKYPGAFDQIAQLLIHHGYRHLYSIGYDELFVKN